MNERVWLQSESPFVNIVRAATVGIFATIALTQCSPGKNEGAEGSVSSEASATAKASSPAQTERSAGVTVIWESQPASAPIVDLSIGVTEAAQTFIAATQADGRLSAFDLDGAKIAETSPNLFTQTLTANHFNLAGANLSAAPALGPNNNIKLALISPEAQSGGGAELDTIYTAKMLCDGVSQSSDSNSISFSAISSGSSGQITQLEINIENDNATLSKVGDDDIVVSDSTSCAQSGPFLVTAEGQRITVFKNGTVENTFPLPDQVTDIALVGEQDTFAILSVLENGELYTSTLMTKDPTPIRVFGGMSTSQPIHINQVATDNRLSNIDYPNGITVISGRYADGQHRTSYLSSKRILTLSGVETGFQKPFAIDLSKFDETAN